MGLGRGLNPPPPNKNIAPPNEMKPICPLGLGFMFFAKFVTKIIIIFYQLKEPAAGGIFFSLRKNVGSNFSRN